MYPRPVLLVDCDGVLSNFVLGFLGIANRLAGTAYVEADVDAWDLDALPGFAEIRSDIWKEVGEPGFARGLAVYPGAQEGVRRLQELGEVFIVTAPLWTHDEDNTRDPLHGQTFCFDRVKWLEEHFGVNRKHVIFAYHKDLVSGSVLIDDKVANIQAWMGAHGAEKRTRAILWAHNYNRDGAGYHPKVTRTDNWDMVASIVEQHCL